MQKLKFRIKREISLKFWKKVFQIALSLGILITGQEEIERIMVHLGTNARRVWSVEPVSRALHRASWKRHYTRSLALSREI